MLRLNEIALLNLIIDERDFFALPSIKKVKITALVAENIYASLIRKGILVSADELTQKGALLVKCMTDYKAASRYVKLGHVIIGIYKEGRGIAVTVNPFDSRYSFTRIDTTIDISSLSKQYPFLQRENTEDPIDMNTTSFQDLKEKGILKYDNSILISSFDRRTAEVDLGKATQNIVLFYYKGNHYTYNCDTNSLKNSTREDSTAILTESVVFR